MLETLTKRQVAITHLIASSTQGMTAPLILQELKASEKISQATLSRDLKPLMDAGYISQQGRARATTYALTAKGKLFLPVDVTSYFQIDADSRTVIPRFNFEIFSLFSNAPIFSPSEKKTLTLLTKNYQAAEKKLSDTILQKEWERVTVEFSWKSSAIEGNTYSLLETETLIRDGIEAKGKKREEATMILNHKNALKFIRENATDFKKLTIPLIEQVHKILVGELEIKALLRKTPVGITGSQYRPLDNEHQIREAIEKMCVLINDEPFTFSKSAQAILLTSYIQPFEDGNKRTARVLGNALLLAGGVFPLSLRSVDVDDYKRAILLFYEINNLSFFKKIFLAQAHFSADNYFVA